MMGRPQRIESKLFYANLSLDERVRVDNPLRRAAAALHLDFVRPAVRLRYGRRGNPSVDPDVLMKLMLLLVLENVPSERELMARMSERLDWMWFCGYDLNSPIHNHSVISKARRRWGVQVFGALFQRVLQQCVEAGLVEGRTLHVDASIIRANAAKDTVHPAFRVAAETLYERLEQQADSPPQADVPPPEAPAAPAAEAVQPPPGTLVSATDPDARLTRKYGQTVLGYKDHRTVDDQCGIITSTTTTDAATAEAHVLNEALDQHERNVGSSPQTVVADKGYGTAEVYQSMAERQITPCIPHQSHNGGKSAGYASTAFQYDAQRDAYRCPQGQWLTCYSTTSVGQRRYRAGKAACAACPQRSVCTSAGDGRRLTRHPGQEWIDWADGCYSREHRRRLGRRRMYRSEGSFADAANNHGYKRARWRGLEGMTIQNLLIAAAQNLRKLLRAWRQKSAAAMHAVKTGRIRAFLTHLARHWTLLMARQAGVQPCATC